MQNYTKKLAVIFSFLSIALTNASDMNQVELARKAFWNKSPEEIAKINSELDKTLINKRVNTKAVIVEEICNGNGDTPFHIVAETGNQEFAFAVYERFPGCLCERQNKQGKTPSEIASENGNPIMTDIFSMAIQEYRDQEERDYDLERREWESESVYSDEDFSSPCGLFNDRPWYHDDI